VRSGVGPVLPGAVNSHTADAINVEITEGIYTPVRCHEIPHRAHAHRTASRRERRITGRFTPSSVRLLDVLIVFMLIQLKPT